MQKRVPVYKDRTSPPASQMRHQQMAANVEMMEEETFMMFPEKSYGKNVLFGYPTGDGLSIFFWQQPKKEI